MTAASAARFPLPRGRAADAALAAGTTVLVAGGWILAFVTSDREEPWPRTALAVVIMLATCVVLYWGRRRPATVAVLVFVGNGFYYPLTAYDSPLMTALVVALYLVAADGQLQAAVALSALTVIGVGIGTLLGNDEINGIAIFMLTGWLVALVALGSMRHSRRVYAEEEALRRTTEERLRIARDLHDVIGHNISLINVQSGAALHRLKKDPEQAAQALGAIKEASRETLRELRATLGVLRQVDEEAPTAPAPGLDRLAELTGPAQSAGLAVRTRIEGERRPLPAEVDLAAYRIVQESLTNAARHARAGEVTVRLGYRGGELELCIEDDGHGGPGDGQTAADSDGSGSGNGIRGMRERARILGGELTAGPRTDGSGYRVVARLPYEIGAARP